MGTEEMNLGPGKLYIENPETGEMQEFAVIDCEIQPVIDMGEVPEECSMKLAKALEDKEITIELHPVPLYRKVSRKRLVKLMMAHKIDRNTANMTAEFCRYMGVAYAAFAVPFQTNGKRGVTWKP